MRQVDLLEPVNISDRLPRLELYLSQVCSVAGISKMQLDYWTTKAEIATKGNKQRVYDMDAGGNKSILLSDAGSTGRTTVRF